MEVYSIFYYCWGYCNIRYFLLMLGIFRNCWSRA